VRAYWLPKARQSRIKDNVLSAAEHLCPSFGPAQVSCQMMPMLEMPQHFLFAHLLMKPKSRLLDTFSQTPAKDNPFVGKWTYRSFLNDSVASV
jgi:hypothetical protein